MVQKLQSQQTGSKECRQASIQLPEGFDGAVVKALVLLEERIEVENKNLCEGAWTLIVHA